MKVKLSDVIDAIEFEGELLTHYYNKKTGVIMYIEDSSTATYKAEDIEDINSFEEWEQMLIKELYDFKNNKEDYIQLPDQNEVNEYDMMVSFANTIEKLEIKDSVIELKKEIENRGYLDKWYDYRENAEYEAAKAWCEKNNIQYEE